MNIPKPPVLRLLSLLLICAAPPALSLPNSVGQGPDRQIGRDIEREIGREVEREIEREVEREVARGVEREVEKRVDRDVDKRLEDQVGRQAERAVGRKFEDQIEATVNPAADVGPSSLPAPALESARPQVKRGPSPRAAESLTNATRAQSPTALKRPSLPINQGASIHRPYPIARYHQAVEDAQGHAHLENQLLVMMDEATVQMLTEKGFRIHNRTRLPSLDKVLVELDADQTEALNHLSTINLDDVKDAQSLNYLYRYQSSGPSDAEVGTGWMPTQAMRLQAGSDRTPVIGLIDSHIETAHPVFAHAGILSESFLEAGLTAATDHGTAVASILVGQSEAFFGLLPNAKLYSAGVFYNSDKLGQTASTKSILLAIDWLLGSGVDVINMSLSGPPNPLLERAVAQAVQQNVLVIAAAGNGGPAATSAYPAAYPGVIAVTAVNRDHLVYFRSNRGRYIDFAAPGVDIAHADSRNGYAKSSGTSFAAPFVTATAASLIGSLGPQKAVAIMQSFALDLGDPDFDSIYGHGLVRPPPNATARYK